MREYVTRIPWETKVKGTRYGTDHTYQLAAEWLKTCSVVADWGGGRGHMQQFLQPYQWYRLYDGTSETSQTQLVDLTTMSIHSDGILMRHVLEMTDHWAIILENMVRAFRRRAVVVTFTPERKMTGVRTHHLSWPVYYFNHERDLIPRMQPFLHHVDEVTASPKLPERVYYLEK